MKAKYKKREYLVQITIDEARKLKGRDDSGSSDPFCKITVANETPQVTTVAKATSAVMWRQSFTFSNVMLAEVELETMEIRIEVLDHNEFAVNALIGAYSIGLGTLYRNMNHEIYNKWLKLLHPNFGSEPQGYLLVSCYIIGKGDSPPVHGVNENMGPDEVDDLDEMPEEEMTAEQIKARKDRANNVATLNMPVVEQRGYQLSVKIAKAEDLPALSFGSCDSFVSVRVEGAGLTTPVIEGSGKPTYNTKLQFPVFVPVLSDKIIVRVWDKRKGMPDTLIANVPEVPTSTDSFNLNVLLSKGGSMPYRWINLYGIPPGERSSELVKFFAGKQKVSEGTSYMGRILMSLNLNPNEKPVLGRYPLNNYREPQTSEYSLIVDVYELQEGMNCGQEVWIEVTIGKSSDKSPKAKLFVDKKSGDPREVPGCYRWKEPDKIKVPVIKGTFPSDETQIPDVFVNLMTETFFGVKRVGYLRLAVTNPTLLDNNPTWYTLKNPENNMDESKAGTLLANIFFTSKTTVNRIPKRRNIDAPYFFIAYIHGAYDLAPKNQEDSMDPMAQISIAPSFEVRTTTDCSKMGKFPVWAEMIGGKVDLCENIEFASNILVKVINKKALKVGGFGVGAEGIIGEFSIPAMRCKQIKKLEEFNEDPSMYVLYKDGEPNGRILASFSLIKAPKKEYRLNKDFIPTLKAKDGSGTIPCTVKLSIVGIRNLNSAVTDNLQVSAKIPGVSQLPNPITPLRGSENKTKNPNFLQVLKFEKIRLPENPLYLPPLQVYVEDKSMFGDKMFLNIPLWDLCEWRNTQSLAVAWNILNSPMVDVQQETEKKPDKAEETKKEKDRATSKGTLKSPVVINAVDGMTNGEKKSPEPAKSGPIDLEALQEEIANQEKKQDSDDEALLLDGNKDKDVINFRVEAQETLDCTSRDKIEEKAERLRQIQELQAKIKQLANDPNSQPSDKMALVQQIERIQAEFIDDPFKFLAKEDKGQDEYDYGRPIVKDPLEKSLAPPYINYRLMKMATLGGTTEHEGIIYSGIIAGPIFKARVRIMRLADDNDGHDSDNDSVHEDQNEKDADKKSHKSHKSKSSQRSDKSNAKAKIIDKDPEYPFNIFRKNNLEFFRRKEALKIRIYLLRGLNLCAQSDVVDIHNQLAGMAAMSSANTFPSIKIGEGSSGNAMMKQITDEQNVVESNLNPPYYRFFELDCELPEDWKLDISILQKGLLSNLLIGASLIDLEDRYYGNIITKQKLAYQIRKEYLENKIKKLESEEDDEKKQKNEEIIQRIKTEMANITGRFESQKNEPVPVEYQPLFNPSKTTSQGSLELFIEVLPIKIARSTPVAKIEPPKPVDYEIRLVIYETFDIPRKNDTVDVQVKVTYSPDGWSGQDVTKATDTHNGSEDGWAIFNWRMKFPLRIPCAFPRLRIAVYDNNLFAADESLGEAIISLKRIIRKLQSEGQYMSEPKRVTLSHVNHQGKSRGEVKYLLHIIPKADADMDPVGEAQEDPNKNPSLDKPKVGRGLADALKGFKLNIWGPIIKRICKMILGLVLSMIITIILFVQPGILVK